VHRPVKRRPAIIPQSPDRRISRYTWWLIIFSLAGLGLRIAYLVSQKGLIVGGDGWYYHFSATLASLGKWFEFPGTGAGPDAHHPPLWTAILSVVAWAGGTDWFPQQIVAAFIGTTAIPLIGLAGRKIAGQRVGLIAAGVAAIYPGLWQYERELLSEVVLMPLVALVLLLVYRFREKPSLARGLLMSAVCTLLCLARAEQLPLVVLVLVPVVLGSRTIDLRRRIGWLAAMGVTAVLILSPWVLFNAARFQEPVLLSTGLGPTMSAGACDSTFSGPLIGNFDAGCTYKRAPDLKQYDRSEGDVKLQSIAIDYTRDHLDELPAVLLAREGRTFGLYRPVQEIRLGTEWSRSPRWVGYLWTTMYTVLVPFAVAGAILLRRRRILLYPLLAEFVIVAFAAATTFGQIRYRAASEVPLLILSAVAFERIWRWWRSRSTAALRVPDPVHEEPFSAVG
jgi:4-amino-4-deoxy-L-arabinose transferase-like glycosyltransferase